MGFQRGCGRATQDLAVCLLDAARYARDSLSTDTPPTRARLPCAARSKQGPTESGVALWLLAARCRARAPCLVGGDDARMRAVLCCWCRRRFAVLCCRCFRALGVVLASFFSSPLRCTCKHHRRGRDAFWHARAPRPSAVVRAAPSQGRSPGLEWLWPLGPFFMQSEHRCPRHARPPARCCRRRRDWACASDDSSARRVESSWREPCATLPL